MVGWMWSHGVGALHNISERFTGTLYADLLDEVIYPSIRVVNPAPELIFLVQNNCPVHKSMVVQQWFDSHPDVIRLFWPARSPDLNPIEHIWAQMALAWEPGHERRSEDLLRHAQRDWERLRSPDGARLCGSLVRSMPARIRDVVRAEGKYSKY